LEKRIMGQQSSIFDALYDDYKIKRSIRLIELFAGYGSQNFGLKYINANYESYKICEWNYKSFHAYKCFHHKEDKTDYSNGLTKEELQKIIYSMGVSADWNKPMNEKQVKALSEEKLREIYNDIKATHNLVDVSKVHANDLEIEPERERERVHSHILISLSGFIQCWQERWFNRLKKWLVMASGENLERTHGKAGKT
jgi:hypothetical protein